MDRVTQRASGGPRNPRSQVTQVETQRPAIWQFDCATEQPNPHSEQNQAVTVFPLSANLSNDFGAPLVRRKAAGATTSPIPKAVPKKRWQAVQWQAKATTGTAVIS
jgi:hypothetical protein